METINIQTSSREELVDITRTIDALLQKNGWSDGAVLIYCPHTTGAITINEAADPSVARDIEVNLRHLIPHKGDYRHMEGNSDAHIKTSLMGPSQMVIVENASLCLGTWQGIYFCEFDGPRSRKIWVKWLG